MSYQTVKSDQNTKIMKNINKYEIKVNQYEKKNDSSISILKMYQMKRNKTAIFIKNCKLQVTIIETHHDPQVKYVYET